MAALLLPVTAAACDRSVKRGSVNYTQLRARLIPPDPRGDSSAKRVVSSDVGPDTSVAVIAYECSPVLPPSSSMNSVACKQAVRAGGGPGQQGKGCRSKAAKFS